LLAVLYLGSLGINHQINILLTVPAGSLGVPVNPPVEKNPVIESAVPPGTVKAFLYRALKPRKSRYREVVFTQMPQGTSEVKRGRVVPKYSIIAKRGLVHPDAFISRYVQHQS
jgi:hypothetical protein